MMSSDPLYVWTIYDHPRDYPDVFVARRWVCIKGEPDPLPLNDEGDVIEAQTLDELRDRVRERGAFVMVKRELLHDDPKIVESWL